jgi:hypothetical protein
MSANGRSRNSPGIIAAEQVALNLSLVTAPHATSLATAIALYIIDIMP